MNAKLNRKKTKNIPYLSQEYFITNHGDIFSFIAMIIVLGLMWKVTTPLASLFIVLDHNVTSNATPVTRQNTLYTPGRRDAFLCFFYTVICIVLHAVIQEYILDKLNKRLHLSKTKYSKFNESGQLTCFYLISIGWALHLIFNENYLSTVYDIWQDYPNIPFSFWTKYFFIFQICYWLHWYPELYLQKVKKEEIPPRVIYITLYLFSVVACYSLNLTRLGLVMLVTNYAVEFIFHAARLVYYSGKGNFSNFGFWIWNVLFVLARIICTTLAYLTFHVFLEKHDRPMVNLSEGNFNTKIIRLNGLVFIFVTQAYMMWNFINFHLRRRNELTERKKAISSTQQFVTQNAGQKKREKMQKKNQKALYDDLNELPEVDQNEQLRQRKNRPTK